MCRKCRAVIFVGDPMRDEESRVLQEEVNLLPGINETDEEEARDDGDAEPDEEIKENNEAAQETSFVSKGPGLYFPFGVPWDFIKEIGFVEAMYETTRDLLLSPRLFFLRMRMHLKSGFIPLYGVLVGIVGAAFNLFWVLWLVRNHRPILERYVPPQLLDYFAAMQTGDILAQVFLSPIVGIIIAAFILFAFSLLFGARAELRHFYRLTGFTAALDLFYAIPFVGWAVAFLWRSVLLIIGMHIITELPMRKVIVIFFLYLFVSLIMLAPAGLPGGG